MQPRESTLELQSKFTAIWSEFANEHIDQMNAGDWLRLFSVLMGIVMSNTSLDESGAQSSAEAAASLALEVRERINNGMVSFQRIQ